MPESVVAIKGPTQTLQKSKPRYTETENEILFESWWNPQKRRELVNRLGRKMSALRSQFCRLLKEKGMSNQDYYNIMHAKYSGESGPAPRKRSRELKEIDRLILETFAKHQAMGNSRAEACEELQQKLGNPFTPAALKLRFYRLLKRLQYRDEDLLKLGNQLINGSKEIKIDSIKLSSVKEDIFTSAINISDIPKTSEPKQSKDTNNKDNSFFYQLSSLPETISNLEQRLNQVESNQRHQLDLRGFIEHLLAVERDLKREDKLLEEVQRLMDENESLNNSLEKERERLKKRELELAEVYKMLNTTLSDFMHLESVSKLASLGDFMHRLEITVDQFGNVLRSKRVLT